MAKQATEEKASSGARQLLGMKGASDETNIWKIRVQVRAHLRAKLAARV